MAFQKQTKITYLLRKALQKLGIKVLAGVNDGNKTIDLSIPSAKMNIEVDGDQHLTDATQIVNDLSRSHFSELKGFETIHIPNKELKENLGGVASALAEASKIREERIIK
jgi:very-short-patch-repair endonuclease